MNITLSVDKTLIEKARRYAKKQNTTLNNLVREYLKKITGQSNNDKAADEFESIALEYGGKSSRDYQFNRDEIYKRTR
jgi:replicative DNA helicase